MKLLKFLFIFLFILLVSSISADEADDLFGEGGDEAFFAVEEEVASVASKYAQKLSETPAILSVLTSSQLQDMGCRTLADALKFVPGIGITIDELGGYEKVTIRGIRQWPNVLFMIDGQRMNNFYSGQALYNMTVDAISKIEIIRGPGSSIHGTGGFVGVINVKTKQNLPEGFTAKAVAGEDRTLRVNVNWSGTFNEWKTNLFAEIFQTDGQKHKLYGEQESSRALEGRTQPHLQIENIGPGDVQADVDAENITRNTLMNLGHTTEDKESAFIDYKMSKNDINMKFKYIYDNRGPNIGLRGWKMPNTRLTNNIFATSIDKNIKINNNISLISKFYFDQQMVNNKYQITGDTPVVSELQDVSLVNRGEYQKIEYIARTYGAEIQNNMNFDLSGKHTLVSGIQFERLGLLDYNFFTKIGNDDTLDEMAQPNRTRTVLGVYLQDEFRPNKFLGFTAGARYDDYSDFGSTFNPKIGAVYLFGKHFKSKYLKGFGLKTSFATAFRAPTFQELYDNTQANMIYGAVGNSDLDPETIETFEIALEYEFKMLRMKANYYTNEIEDQIGYYPGLLGTVAGSSNPYFNNPNTIKTKGYELELKTVKHTFHSFFPNSWFWINLSKVEIEADEFNIGITPMKAVDRTELPQWEFSFGINTGISKYFRLSVNYEKISERYSNTRTSIESEINKRWKIDEQEEYNLHVYTTPELIKDYTFGLKIFNATDENNYDDPTTIGSQEVQRENKTVLGYMTVKF